MTMLMQASREWASRPADERFISLKEMLETAKAQRHNSRQLTVANRSLKFMPEEDNKGIYISGPKSEAHVYPTHWAFSQAAQRAESPAPFLRTLPSPIVADILNWKIQKVRDVEELGMLIYRNGSLTARAITGPKYGRIWNEEVIEEIIDRFGNAVQGNGSPWQAPGMFGQAVVINKDNTTFFMGESDMFVFLCDEENKIEIPGRGLMSRGFFVWNSEVGKSILGIATFFFDHVCCNRIVWGATQYKQIRIRHTAGAPIRWEEEVQPALESYRQSSTKGIIEAIADARAHRLDSDEVAKFIETRFGKRMSAMLEDVHMDEEKRPIETRWDIVTAATAYAKRIKNQDDRVQLESKAGALLDLKAS